MKTGIIPIEQSPDSAFPEEISISSSILSSLQTKWQFHPDRLIDQRDWWETQWMVKSASSLPSLFYLLPLQYNQWLQPLATPPMPYEWSSLPLLCHPYSTSYHCKMCYCGLYSCRQRWLWTLPHCNKHQKLVHRIPVTYLCSWLLNPRVYFHLAMVNNVREQFILTDYKTGEDHASWKMTPSFLCVSCLDSGKTTASMSLQSSWYLLV